MGAARGDRRSPSHLRRQRFEIFPSGTKTGDGVMMESGVQMDPVDQEQPRSKGRRVFTILFLVVIVLVLVGALTLFQRRSQYQALAKETETLAIPTVAVIHATVKSAGKDPVPPGPIHTNATPPTTTPTPTYLKK